MIEVLFSVVVLTVLVIGLAALILVARDKLMPENATTITVNGINTFDAVTGQKLLGALTSNGIMVPSVCAGGGTCGLCRVTIEDGADPIGSIEKAKLSAADIRDGVRLACQVTMRRPVSLRVPDALLGTESVQCDVTGARSLTPLIREIVFQFPDGKWPHIVAGDYIQVEAPAYKLDFSTLDIPTEHMAALEAIRGLHTQSDQPVTRAYSISNRLEDTQAGRVVLNIRLALPPPSAADAPPGIVSSWMFGLSVGDKAKLTGPFGSFRALDTDKEMVLIGGGVGMAPLRAIIHEQLAIKGNKRKMSYWYGARSKAELFYVDELDGLAKSHKNFTWTVSLSEPTPDDDWRGPTGFIHSVVLDRYLSKHEAPEECEYYLCGPPLMMRAVRAMLDDLGVEPDCIFYDDFGV